MKPATLSKTISAFANAAGGELYVGVFELALTGQENNITFGAGAGLGAEADMPADPLPQALFLALGDDG